MPISTIHPLDTAGYSLTKKQPERREAITTAMATFGSSFVIRKLTEIYVKITRKTALVQSLAPKYEDLKVLHQLADRAKADVMWASSYKNGMSANWKHANGQLTRKKVATNRFDRLHIKYGKRPTSSHRLQPIPE